MTSLATFSSTEPTDVLDAHALFCSRRYDQALTAARREAGIDDEDCFQIGPTMTIGMSLLLLGRYEEAQEHIGALAAVRHVGARISDRFIYAGLAHWFDGETQKALEL